MHCFWTSGSAYFSDAVLPENRETFIDSIVKFSAEYGVDGYDFDWEYPKIKGAEENIVRDADTDNLLEFVKELRQALGQGPIVSLAVPFSIWYGSDGQPMTDVSAFVPSIDWVFLMSYDAAGATNMANAPLENTCPGQASAASVKSSVNAWHAAGMPHDKIVLGLPAHGYVSNTTAIELQHRRAKRHHFERARRTAHMRHHKRGGLRQCKEPIATLYNVFTNASVSLTNSTWLIPDSPLPPCPAYTGDGNLTEYIGQPIPFNQIHSHSAIGLELNGTSRGLNGFRRVWDNCTSTPYLYSETTSTFVTFDDPESLSIKAKYAVDEGLKGVGMWSIDHDEVDYVLSKAIVKALGRAE